MTPRKVLIALAFVGLIAAACSDSGTVTPTTDGDVAPTTSDSPDTTMSSDGEWPDKIVFGFIPSEQQETLETNIQPFMDAIEAAIGIEVEGLVTSDYNGLVVALGTGRADFGAFGPFGYVQAKDQYPDVEVLIQSIRFGSDLYHGQWFTNDPTICDAPPVPGAFENVDGVPTILDPTEVAALQVGWEVGDDGIIPESLDDGTPVEPGLACTAGLDKVVGRSIAFTSSTSTSGAVFPQLQLINMGVDIENDIQYDYLGSHDNAVLAVYNREYDIGLSFDDARRSIRDEFPDVGSKVIVFNITDDIPNDVVAVRGDLPDDLKQAVYDAIEAYLQTEEGRAVLDEIYGWTDIRPAAESDFDIVREAAEKLGVTSD